MRRYLVPILSFLSVPILAIPLAVFSIVVLGPYEQTFEAAAYFKSVNYVFGVWVGYMLWGRS